MVRYVLKRIGFAILTMYIASTVLFILLQFMPGKPWDQAKATPEQKATLTDQFDLDEPAVLQYFKFISGIAGFRTEIDDGSIESMEYQFFPYFGRKWRGDRKFITDIIGELFPVSVSVGVQGLIIGLIVGLIFGSISALKRNKIWDHLLTVAAVIGVSVPSFVFASLLQYYLGFKLHIFPITYDIADTSISSILPAIALSLFVIASLTRYMRTELVDVLNTDYILLARAKGLSKPKIIVKHAIRNALIPVITVVGPLALAVLSGSIVIEKIFTIPGIGRQLVDAIQQKDNPLILGISFFFTFLYIFVILLVDLSYGLIDPRVRIAGGKE